MAAHVYSTSAFVCIFRDFVWLICGIEVLSSEPENEVPCTERADAVFAIAFMLLGADWGLVAFGKGGGGTAVLLRVSMHANCREQKQ